jgi:hypothetical protein
VLVAVAIGRLVGVAVAVVVVGAMMARACWAVGPPPRDRDP